jgi:hypothetical protein
MEYRRFPFSGKLFRALSRPIAAASMADGHDCHDRAVKLGLTSSFGPAENAVSAFPLNGKQARMPPKGH